MGLTEDILNYQLLVTAMKETRGCEHIFRSDGLRRCIITDWSPSIRHIVDVNWPTAVHLRCLTHIWRNIGDYVAERRKEGKTNIRELGVPDLSELKGLRNSPSVAEFEDRLQKWRKEFPVAAVWVQSENADLQNWVLVKAFDLDDANAFHNTDTLGLKASFSEHIMAKGRHEWRHTTLRIMLENMIYQQLDLLTKKRAQIEAMKAGCLPEYWIKEVGKRIEESRTYHATPSDGSGESYIVTRSIHVPVGGELNCLRDDTQRVKFAERMCECTEWQQEGMV